MAAAHEPGILRFYYQRGGVRKLVHQSHSTISAPSSGAATDPRLFLDEPMRAEPLLGDGELVATYEAEATDTLDSTDGSWNVPIVKDGQRVFLNDQDFDASDTSGKDTYKDQPLVANTEIVIGVYTVPKGSKIHFGGGKLYVNLFDDTA